MKNRLLSGIVTVVLGLLIALVPAYIFPTCAGTVKMAGGGDMPMKCFWSGQAEIGVGLLILCGGILLIAFKPLFTRIGVSCMIALTGVLGIFFPTLLIGGCDMPTMTCRMTTFPAVIVLNSLTIAVGVINIIYLCCRDKKNKGKADGQ